MTKFTLDPRLEADSVFVRDLPLCQLRLQNNKNVPWLILVPRCADVREIFELNESDRAQLMREISDISAFACTLFDADKMNVAALGNQVPQLHVHIIARKQGDSAWPNPVWGKIPNHPYEPAQLSAILASLQETK